MIKNIVDLNTNHFNDLKAAITKAMEYFMISSSHPFTSFIGLFGTDLLYEDVCRINEYYTVITVSL